MCFVQGKQINEAIFFFISEKQTGTVNGTVSEIISELSGLPTLKNLIQFVFGDPFLPKGTKLKLSFQGSHFPDADSCFGILHLPCDHDNYSSFKRAMNSCINCQFVGYGRGRIREQMLENLNMNFCLVQRVFLYKSFEEIGFYNRPLMTY